jgi:hypothetical protein
LAIAQNIAWALNEALPVGVIFENLALFDTANDDMV